MSLPAATTSGVEQPVALDHRAVGGHRDTSGATMTWSGTRLTNTCGRTVIAK